MSLGASAFNGDLSKWYVAKVTDMTCMFLGASAFSGDLSKWYVARVTDMTRMLYGASAFNGDLSKWYVAKVTALLSSDLVTAFLQEPGSLALLSRMTLRRSPGKERRS